MPDGALYMYRDLQKVLVTVLIVLLYISFKITILRKVFQSQFLFDFDIFILQTKRSTALTNSVTKQLLVLGYKHMFKDDPSYMYIHIKKKRTRIIQLVLNFFLKMFRNKKNIPKFVHLDIILDT